MHKNTAWKWIKVKRRFDPFFSPELKGDSAKKILKEFIKDTKIDNRPYLLIIESKNENSKNKKKQLENGRNGQKHWTRLQGLFEKAGYPPPDYEVITNK